MSTTHEAQSRGSEPGDRIVSGDGERWMQYRYNVDGTITKPRYHASREAAVREARRLADKEGVRLFELRKESGDDLWKMVPIPTHKHTLY